jgi:hypothetical protein
VKPSSERVLEYLRTHGGRATTRELCQPEVGGVRFGARLAEIRAEGAVIDGKRLRPGSYLYTLTRDIGLDGGSSSLASVESGAVAAEVETGSLDHNRRPSPESAPAPASGQLFDLEPQSAVLSDHEAA